MQTHTPGPCVRAAVADMLQGSHAGDFSSGSDCACLRHGRVGRTPKGYQLVPRYVSQSRPEGI